MQDFSRGGYDGRRVGRRPFSRRGVPAVAFFTGFHADYHRPSDDWPGIDAEGGAAIATLALRLVEELARQRFRPVTEQSGRFERTMQYEPAAFHLMQPAVGATHVQVS